MSKKEISNKTAEIYANFYEKFFFAVATGIFGIISYAFINKDSLGSEEVVIMAVGIACLFVIASFSFIKFRFYAEKLKDDK